MTFLVSMTKHVDEDAQQEEEHMVGEPMVLFNWPGKEHCNDIFINKLLLWIIINNMKLSLLLL